MRATLPNSFSKKVFLASGGKPSTDFGSDFKRFSLYRELSISMLNIEGG